MIRLVRLGRWSFNADRIDAVRASSTDPDVTVIFSGGAEEPFEIDVPYDKVVATLAGTQKNGRKEG